MTFVCLANFRSNDEYGIAGIDSAGKWVRFVNPGGEELRSLDMEDKKGRRPKLLETWKVKVLKQEPLYFQPENWIIDREYIWGESFKDIAIDLTALSAPEEPAIFGGSSDRLPSQELMQQPIQKSLMLIYCDQVIFRKTNHRDSRFKLRAIFDYNGNSYDLPVADTEWEKRFRGPYAEFAECRDHLFAEGFYLTIGLGGEADGDHYKLVTGVIPADMT